MSFFVNYILQLFYPTTEKIEEIKNGEEDDDIYIVKYLVSITDIKSVKLNPVRKTTADKLLQRPYDKVNLRSLNNSQLRDILNVKLKPVVIRDKTTKQYEIRHPVLNELLEKFKK